MRQPIGRPLVLALTLSVMVAPAAAQLSGPTDFTAPVPIFSHTSKNAAVAVPNFISYRDRARSAADPSDADDLVEFADDHDPIGLRAPTVPIPPPRPR